MKNIYFKRGKIFIDSRYKKTVKNAERVVVIPGLIIALSSWFLKDSLLLNILGTSVALLSFILVEFFVIFEVGKSTVAISTTLERNTGHIEPTG